MKNKRTVERLRAELKMCRARLLINREMVDAFASLLIRTTNALKGRPKSRFAVHDWSDLPSVARKLRMLAERKK